MSRLRHEALETLEGGHWTKLDAQATTPSVHTKLSATMLPQEMVTLESSPLSLLQSLSLSQLRHPLPSALPGPAHSLPFAACDLGSEPQYLV